MSLKTIDIKPCYESGTDNLVEDFYIPVLSECKYYDRLAGFFSSTSLAIASRGISHFVKNGGKIRLISCPRLCEDDVIEIQKALKNPLEYLEKILLKDLDKIDDLFVEDHLGALGWLIARNSLEIKVALVIDTNGKYLTEKEIHNKGIFHQKVGLLCDLEGNKISFSGSINETASGWLSNFEEFKVFKQWEPGQSMFYDSDFRKFYDIWESKSDHLRVFEIPEAVKQRLIQKSSNDPMDALSIQRYRDNINRVIPRTIDLYPFQQEAVIKWLKNEKKLICEMATGTGKTRTALGCICQLINAKKPVVIIIACPQSTLSMQWKDEIRKNAIEIGDELIADSTNPKWKTEIIDLLQDVSLGSKKSAVIYVTHDTCCSDDFIEKLSQYKNKFDYFFIGDEAHGLGASKTSNGLQSFYDFRLGLSATPRRWYDDIGTKAIYDFFGEDSYEFTIKQALLTINPSTNKPFLCNYYYYPIFITLTEEELIKYCELSGKISKMSKFGLDNPRRKAIFENLLFKRADIHKSAKNKIGAFEEILLSLERIEDLIVFVSPPQIGQIQRILAEKGILANRFTEKEGTIPEIRYSGRSERQFLIDKFKEQKIKALLAIKCLDEGIDIPSAKTAIILASSTNPREYIQRIGRVIRQAPGKAFSRIYDVIVKPNSEHLPDELRIFEIKVFEKEMIRSLDIAENALNNAEASQQIFSILHEEG